MQVDTSLNEMDSGSLHNDKLSKLKLQSTSLFQTPLLLKNAKSQHH